MTRQALFHAHKAHCMSHKAELLTFTLARVWEVVQVTEQLHVVETPGRHHLDVNNAHCMSRKAELLTFTLS